MNQNDYRIFGVFIGLVAVACVAISGIAVSIGDTPLAIFAVLATIVAAFICADAFRYHGKHEHEERFDDGG